MSSQAPSRPRVVIVGAGFAGVNAAKTLRRAPVDVVVIDRNNYHKFQPLLYQVATAGLEPDEIAYGARQIFRRWPSVSFRLGTVRAIDPVARRIALASGDDVHYDFLILAAGAVTNTFGLSGVRAHAFSLKSLPDAIELRSHLLRVFERVDREAEGAGPGALNVVVVGGGPTGVELAGALVELFDVMRKDFRNVDTKKARVFLVEAGPDLLPPYTPPLRAYTRRVLEKRGVTVLTGATVSRVTADAVFFEDREPIPTRTLVWAAGIRGHPIAGTAGVELAGGGRVVVGPDLRVPGHPEAFVTGDLAAGRDARGAMLPQVAQVAIQQGVHAARQVLRLVEGRPTEPFRYRDFGQLATIGRHAAVAEFGRVTLRGFVAWFVWVFVHLMKLVGFRNRLNVFVNWAYNYFTYDRNARIILDVIPIPDEVRRDVEEIDRDVKARMGHEERSI